MIYLLTLLSALPALLLFILVVLRILASKSPRFQFLFAKPPEKCSNCKGRGRVANHRLQVFEDCPRCVPMEEPVQGLRPGSRSRTSGLAERVV